MNQPLGIDQCNCFASRKAARQITRFYDAHLEPAGLRITQFLTLAALSEAGSVAVNALAERLDIERTAMGKMLGFLERDGLITIHPSPVDGRSRLVGLTKRGSSPTCRSVSSLARSAAAFSTTERREKSGDAATETCGHGFWRRDRERANSEKRPANVNARVAGAPLARRTMDVLSSRPVARKPTRRFALGLTCRQSQRRRPR